MTLKLNTLIKPMDFLNICVFIASTKNNQIARDCFVKLSLIFSDCSNE